MKKPHIPGKVRAVVGAIAVASLAAAPGALAVESSPTPQAAAMGAAFMEYLPPPSVAPIVCVVDTGVDLTPDTQPFVSSRLSVMADALLDDLLAPDGHGTAVSAVMGAPRDGVGGVGLWPHLKVISFRATSSLSAGSAYFGWPDYDRALSLCWRQPGVKVANFSLGGNIAGVDYPFFVSEVQSARASGVSVVAAAGNTPGPVIYPAAADGVVAVAANDGANGGSLCWFSAAQPGVLSAPGCNVEATGKTGAVMSWNGTSLASPLVSVLLASLRSYRPDLSRQQVEGIVRQSAKPTRDGQSLAVDAEGAYRAAGLGAMVDAAKARVPGAGVLPDPPVDPLAVVPVNPAAPKVRWVRVVRGVAVIRITPLGSGVRLRLTGAGRFRRVNATTIRATPGARAWRLSLRAVGPEGGLSPVSFARIAAKRPAR